MSGSHRRPATAPDAAAAKAVTRTGRGGHQHDVRTLHRNVQGSSALCGEWWPGKSRRKGRGRLAGAYAPQTPVAQPVRGAHVPPTSILGKRTSTLLQAQRLNQHPPLQPNKSTRAPVPTLVRTSAPAASASPTPRPPCRPAPCLAEVGDRARGSSTTTTHAASAADAAGKARDGGRQPPPRRRQQSHLSLRSLRPSRHTRRRRRLARRGRRGWC